MTKAAINFLHDYYYILYEQACEARDDAKKAQTYGQTREKQAFAAGRALAYYEVVSSFIHHAEVFALDADAIGFQVEHSEKLLP